MTAINTDVRISVPNVQLARNVTQPVRFRIIRKSQTVRVTTMHQQPLFVRRLPDGRFAAAPRNELPRIAVTPDLAAAKAIKAFWEF